MTLQATHKELECSHEKLVDSYASLEIAHEVVLSSVKYLQPLTPICTCSFVNNEFACIKSCCIQASQSSIEHVFVETCDDLIAQENDELKQEVEKLKRDLHVLKEESQVQPSQDKRDDMVKKLEKGSTVTNSTPQQHIKIIKGNIQAKKTGHDTPHPPTKLKAQETISKNKRRSTRGRLCYICKEKGHLAADCTQSSCTDQGRSNRPQGRLNRVWCTTAAMRRKFTLQARSLYASQDKTGKWIPSPEVPKAAFATHVERRVTWQ
jgi:hypothetical protein